MDQKQALYEQCLLHELEDLFFFSRVLGAGKERIESMDTSNISAFERERAREDCRRWADAKLLGRFNKNIFKEPVEISIKFDKGLKVNYFTVEGEIYKLIMCIDTNQDGFAVWLRSMLKEDE